MTEKRYSRRQLVITGVGAFCAGLLVLLGLLWALVGSEGLGMVETMVLIRTSFVGEHDIGKATDQAMNSLIVGLGDRWSYYMDADSYRYQKESKDNVYVGLGCTVTYPGEEGLLVASVVENGPADKAGLVPGDLVLEVDGVPMTGEYRANASQYTRDPEGSKAELLVLGADGARRTVTVIRARVEEHPVSWELLSDGTGLVTIANFNRRSAEEAKAAVEDLQAQGAARLVFDVRNNGGGYMYELKDLLDYLLPEGVLFRQSRKLGLAWKTKSDAACVDLPMAVLVNGETYSAAELFAAELQEMGWGVVVGEPTFGKGFSQQTFPLPTGGAVNLSTGKYFTGGGVCLIGTGLTLDREVTLTGEETALLRAKALPRETDPQLQTAIAMLTAE